METVFAILVGLFFAAGIYLMLSRAVIRILIGVILFGNAVNLLIFTAGRMTSKAPPIIAAGAEQLATGTANPLPQALILTAIVISFSFTTFLLVLAFRAFQAMGSDDTKGMQAAEPQDAPMPPLGY